MKRPSIRRGGVRSPDIKGTLSQKRLAGIGAACLAYNQAEELLDDMVGIGLTGTPNRNLASRINGVEGKIELVKLAARDLALPNPIRLSFAETLGEAGFKLLRTYRNGVVHSIPYVSPEWLGVSQENKGKTSDILLSDEALDTLYDALIAIEPEIHSLYLILDAAYVLKHGPGDDQEKGQLEEYIRECFAQYQGHRNARLSLPQFPEFPEEPAYHVIRVIVPQDAPKAAPARSEPDRA